MQTKDLNGSVTAYEKAVGTVEVNFPAGKVFCQFCPLFLRYEDNFKRYSCRLTGEWILDPFHDIGSQCPLVFKEESK